MNSLKFNEPTVILLTQGTDTDQEGFIMTPNLVENILCRINNRGNKST